SCPPPHATSFARSTEAGRQGEATTLARAAGALVALQAGRDVGDECPCEPPERASHVDGPPVLTGYRRATDEVRCRDAGMNRGEAPAPPSSRRPWSPPSPTYRRSWEEGRRRRLRGEPLKGGRKGYRFTGWGSLGELLAGEACVTTDSNGGGCGGPFRDPPRSSPAGARTGRGRR